MKDIYIYIYIINEQSSRNISYCIYFLLRIDHSGQTLWGGGGGKGERMKAGRRVVSGR